MEPVFPFDLLLATGSPGTLAQQLHQQLRSAILDGRLAAGAHLPATRRVSTALGVARNTVIAAYDLLIAEGYAIPRKGATARVADIARRRPRPSPAWTRPIEDPRLDAPWRAPFLRSPQADDLPERSFRLGMPEYRGFPREAWRRLSARSLRAWSRQPFDYPPSEGLPVLRGAIAQHVAFARAVACTADDVVVTSGAQQAFDLLARLLVTAGRTRIAVEEPGYPPVRAAFAAAGAELVPVPVDDDGMCIDQVPQDVQVISVTPSHQSPTGATLSLQRRVRLLEHARSQRAVVIEDDYDGEFRFGGRPLDALQTLDRDALVFYVGTFSKSLFPALRKGFVVAPGWAREALVAAKHHADPHCDAIAQAVLAAFIREGHLARHVRRMTPVYAQRRDALLDGLHGELGEWLEPIPSEAGLHLAARIRPPAMAAALLAKARMCTPGAQSTGDYSMTTPAQPALAFGYGVIDAGEIGPALSRLRRALASGP